MADQTEILAAVNPRTAVGGGSILAPLALAAVAPRLAVGASAAVGSAQTVTVAGVPSGRATGALTVPIQTYAQYYAAMVQGVLLSLYSNRSDLGIASFRTDINKTFVDVSAIIQLLLANSLVTQQQLDAARMLQMAILANIYQDWWANVGGISNILQTPLIPPMLSYFNMQNDSTPALTSLVSTSFTPATNDVIVVKVVTADDSCVIGTPTSSTGLTFTQRIMNTHVSNCQTAIYTAIATFPVPTTITVPFTGVGFPRSFVVEDWNGAVLATTPANGKANSATGTPTAIVTTVASNSVVSWCNGDWIGIAPGSPSYLNGAVQEQIDDQSGIGDYVAYYAYQVTGRAGAQSIGMVSPAGQKWTAVGIEIKSSGGGLI